MTIGDRAVRFRKRAVAESARSAEVLASNDDLLTELLLLLPVKSLLKFQSVCKHWLSLISDPHLARRKHLKSSAVSALYLNCESPQEGVEHYKVTHLETGVALEHLDFAGYPRRIEIDQSCNGLLLIYSSQEEKYMVYNPTTKQSKTLPPVPRDEVQVWGFSLAFDPSISHFYKVVCVLCDNHGWQILIYSSEIGRWRVCGAPFTPLFQFGVWTGVYCNGAIHWVCMKRDFSLYFDLNKELVQAMPQPPPLDNLQGSPGYVGESGGRLYLVVSVGRLTTYLNVYQMEIDRSGWFLKFRVDSDTLAGFTMPSEGIYIRSILYVARGEKEEDSFMVLSISNHKVILYNFLSQTHREICQVDFRTYVWGPAHVYIESLWNVQG